MEKWNQSQADMAPTLTFFNIHVSYKYSDPLLVQLGANSYKVLSAKITYT